MFSNILGGAAGFPVADLGDEISQSLRFGGSHHLQRTHTSTGNRSKFTISFWVKQSQFGVTNQWASAYNDNSDSGNFTVGHADTGEFQSGLYTRGTFTSPGLYRDPSAWYHVVVSVDGTDGHFYINGEEIIDSSASWNSQYAWNAACLHRIGRNSFNTNFPCQGYLADFHNLDGQALDPTDFGRTNEDGVWVPIATDFTAAQYGTNGFHLTFDSSQTNAGIGEDSAPIGASGHTARNDFTATGFDTAAISSTNEDNDIDYNDTPTNNYATLNPLNVFDASVTYSKANLRANYGGTGNRVVFVDMPMAAGKYYWELTLKDQVEGWAGVITEDYVKRQLTSFADNSDSWAYDLSGSTDNQKRHNGSNTSSHGSLVANDTIGFLLDIASGTLKIEINGTTQSNSEFTNIPTSKRLFVAFNIGGGSGNVNMDWNFGQMPFVHSQTGYSDVATNILPEPTIKNGKEHFDVVTWSGNDTAPRDISGLDFQPDLVWVKSRNAGHDHQLVDSVRGATRALRANASNSEDTWTDGLSAFNVDGFELNDDGTNARYNASGTNYVAWCWKAGGTAVSNTDGTITSSVSANTTAGFSIVSYTGNSTNGATVGHGLSSPPEWILFKTRSIADNWRVYHVSVGATEAFQLDNSSGSNGTLAAFQDDFLSDTVPNSTTITLGDTSNVNGTGTQIAYCWHSVEGFSKFGSYEGNNDSDGTFVYLGFKPSLIIFKNADAVGSWVMYDTARNIDNPVDTRLTANSNSDEGTSASMHVDFLSNGFKHRNSDQDLNTSHTFVYMAWAENPFGGENTAPATAR